MKQFVPLNFVNIGLRNWQAFMIAVILEAIRVLLNVTLQIYYINNTSINVAVVSSNSLFILSR